MVIIGMHSFFKKRLFNQGIKIMVGNNAIRLIDIACDALPINHLLIQLRGSHLLRTMQLG